jgi:hypothetical protein
MFTAFTYDVAFPKMCSDIQAVAPSSQTFTKEWLPIGAPSCPGQNFFLPSGFNMDAIVAAGRAGGLSPSSALSAVGHYGTFDFQRQKTVFGTVFYTGYTNASNIAVGAYLYGAGFSELGASLVSNSFALTMSSNAGDPAQSYYRNLGYETAASGKGLSCTVNP